MAQKSLKTTTKIAKMNLAKIWLQMAKEGDENPSKMARNRQKSPKISKLYVTPKIRDFIAFLCHFFLNFEKVSKNFETFSVKTWLYLPAAYSFYVFLFSPILVQYEDRQNYQLKFAPFVNVVANFSWRNDKGHSVWL